MEEIVGGTISFLLRVFVWIIIDLLFDIVCWGLGWAVLKLVTVGKYPDKNTSENTVSIVGAVVFILLLVALTSVIT